MSKERKLPSMFDLLTFRSRDNEGQKHPGYSVETRVSVADLQSGLSLCLREIERRILDLKRRIEGLQFAPDSVGSYSAQTSKNKAELLGIWQFVHKQSEQWDVLSPSKIAEAINVDVDVLKRLGITPMDCDQPDILEVASE